MIKKIFIILFVIILTSSCGKKGDPLYKESKKIEISKAQQITLL